MLFFAFGSIAHAEDYVTEVTAMYSAVKVTNCDNPQAPATLSETALRNSKQQITPTQEEDAALRKKLGCVTADKPSKYVLKNTQTIQIGKNRYGVAEVVNTKTGVHRFIMKSSLMTYFEVDTSCHAGDMGGQVNRMEADKDGRLYLKKYMVTSECVNGKSKAVWKPLN